MTISMKIDTNGVQALFTRAKSEIKRINQEAYDFFKATTPIRSGNARRNTSLRKDTIVANYPYAGRLDEGYSSQAENGMTQPTEEELQNKIIPAAIRRINRGK